MASTRQVEAWKRANLNPPGQILYYSTVEEFDAYLAGRLELAELRRRVDRRRGGREPVEPVGGSRQSSIRRWCD